NSFDGKNFTHYRHSDNDSSSLSNDNVWEIFEDPEHNLWIGTLGSGLDMFDRTTRRFRHNQYNGGPNDPVPSNYISSILEDKKGNIWVGTAGGLGTFKKGSTSSIYYLHTNDKSSLANNNINCLLEDSRGAIWVGTREGLSLFNEQTK